MFLVIKTFACCALYNYVRYAGKAHEVEMNVYYGTSIDKAQRSFFST